MTCPPARIAIMLPRFSRYGGVEQFGYRLSEALASRGHAVDFICARQEMAPPEGVRVLRTGRPYGPKWLKMLIFACRGERLRRKGGYDCTVSLGKTLDQDIMRVGGGPLQAFWRLSGEAWPSGLPRAVKQLSRRLQPANWLTILIEKRMFTKTPCIVAISDAVYGWVSEVYPHLAPQTADPAAKQELLTIRNCPDTSLFRKPTPQEKVSAKQRLVPGENAYVIGMATTNFALKGVGQTIEAMPLLPGDVHLCVAGGRNPERYQKLAERLGLGGRVHFCGKISDMQAFYHGLDLFILPTFYDTFGNVVLEAMACGVKTICSDRAGAMAFLPESRILRNPASPAAIADSIRSARADDTEYSTPLPKAGGVEEFAALVEKVAAQNRREAGQDILS